MGGRSWCEGCGNLDTDCACLVVPECDCHNTPTAPGLPLLELGRVEALIRAVRNRENNTTADIDGLCDAADALIAEIARLDARVKEGDDLVPLGCEVVETWVWGRLPEPGPHGADTTRATVRRVVTITHPEQPVTEETP